jgi:hypothetical protein
MNRGVGVMNHSKEKLEDLKTSHILGGKNGGRGDLRRGKKIGYDRFDRLRV